jgi:hypothetical protein
MGEGKFYYINTQSKNFLFVNMNNKICHLRIKSAHLLTDLRIKSAHFGLLIFITNFKSSPPALWECGFRGAESKALWEVWERRKTFSMISTMPSFPRSFF